MERDHVIDGPGTAKAEQNNVILPPDVMVETFLGFTVNLGIPLG